ncbi:MAG: hypothetical protein BRC58_08775 [Cyanobacteria bacterium QS_8_64_29]|nr:MAG: hypothetical protein BRC58_08775 [Cyanobacteria bacterium QS_8_64_29]
MWLGEQSLPQLLQTAPTERGIYRCHLQRYLQLLHADSELTEAMQAVVYNALPVPLLPHLSYRLEQAGLIRLQRDRAVPRCPLYREYLSARL